MLAYRMPEHYQLQHSTCVRWLISAREEDGFVCIESTQLDCLIVGRDGHIVQVQGQLGIVVKLLVGPVMIVASVSCGDNRGEPLADLVVRCGKFLIDNIGFAPELLEQRLLGELGHGCAGDGLIAAFDQIRRDSLVDSLFFGFFKVIIIWGEQLDL